MPTAAPEPGANPQSGLMTIRSGARTLVACRTRAAIVSGESISPGVTLTQPRPISKSSRSFLKDSQIAGAGCGELHREMVRPQPIQLIDDGLIAALKLRLAAPAGARAPAQVHGKLGVPAALHDGVDHVHGEVGRRVGIGKLSAHVRIDEQTQMRIVDLDDIGAGLLDQFKLALEDGDAIADEVFALRIGLGRFFGMPHALAEQRRGRQRCLDLSRRDRLEEMKSPGQ